MPEFPYVPTTGKLKQFLTTIQSAGVPPKVDLSLLSTLGFKSSNDRRFIGVLKAIDFVDSSGVPTEKWKQFRNKSEAPRVLASAIVSSPAYSGLFQMYPDAHRKDQEALRNYFSGRTSHSAETVGDIVNTFRALCDLADFDTARSEAQTPVAGLVNEREGRSPVAQVIGPAVRGPEVNIRIELTIPATDDPKVYEALFSSMKKHLFADS